MQRITKEIREALRAKREADGVSASRLAAQLGVAGTTLRRWESGKTARISEAQLERLMQSIPIRGGGPDSAPSIPPEFEGILILYRKMPPKLRRRLRQESAALLTCLV